MKREIIINTAGLQYENNVDIINLKFHDIISIHKGGILFSFLTAVLEIAHIESNNDWNWNDNT